MGIQGPGGINPYQFDPSASSSSFLTPAQQAIVTAGVNYLATLNAQINTTGQVISPATLVADRNTPGNPLNALWNMLWPMVNTLPPQQNNYVESAMNSINGLCATIQGAPGFPGLPGPPGTPPGPPLTISIQQSEIASLTGILNSMLS